MSASNRIASGASPRFFQALCRTASEGGTGGYEWAGYGLIGHVAGIMFEDHDDEEAAARLDELAAAICKPFENGYRNAPDDKATLSWFDRELPRCMALVPRARRHQFLKGVYRAVLDEEQDVFSV